MIYKQSTGKLTTDKGELIYPCYSGNNEGKNNPDWQHVKNKGPIPCGDYAIGKPYDSKSTGPFTLPLIPDPTNEMFGRGGFAMHGDSLDDPGNASHGCIIAPQKVRKYIWSLSDKFIKVIP